MPDAGYHVFNVFASPDGAFAGEANQRLTPAEIRVGLDKAMCLVWYAGLRHSKEQRRDQLLESLAAIASDRDESHSSYRLT